MNQALTFLIGSVLMAASCSPITTESPIIHAPATIPTPASGWWRPAPGTTLQWQLDGSPLDTSVDVDAYDLDLFDTPAGIVSELHTQGARVICYLSAGSWEDWRPDAANFPPELLGKDYEDWEGEKWLDIRRIDLLAPILQARLDLCRDKVFDAVEADNIDGYTNETGFPLSTSDQLNFNRWLAMEAHARGLSIGLKNDPDQAVELVDYFDWALTEDCFDQGWCEQMIPFIEAGKAVFAVEYTDTRISMETFCPEAHRLKFSAMLKHRNLDAWRDGCH